MRALGLGWASGRKIDGEKYEFDQECQMLRPDTYSFLAGLPIPAGAVSDK